MGMQDAERFEPSTLADWHDWLREHHQRPAGVWLVVPRAGATHLTYDELIREALCWGWIDGQARPWDEARSLLWFSHRRRASLWSASNKARVADLEREGRLQPEGIAEIERAKADGRWTLMDSVDALIEPPELTAALDAEPAARRTWDAYPPSAKKLALAQIAMAKRAETKASRIAGTVQRASRGERP